MELLKNHVFDWNPPVLEAKRPEGSWLFVKHIILKTHGDHQGMAFLPTFFSHATEKTTQRNPQETKHPPAQYIGSKTSKLLQGPVWNNYWGYYCIPCIYTFMEFTIIKVYTPYFSDFRSKIRSHLQNFKTQHFPNILRFNAPFHDPNPSSLTLL